MDAKKSFKAFLNDVNPTAKFEESEILKFEELVTPHVLRILQKDATLFDSPFEVFGVDISPIFAKKPDMIWKHVQACSMAAFLNGDIKTKFSKILDSLKSIWGGTGHNTDEIDKLIGNPESQDKISEIFEFVMTTRVAKIVMNMAEQLDISELGLDFENPEEVIKVFQNMENNPVIEKIMKKIQAILQDKVKKGEFTKETLTQDIERIKVKVQEAFGDMFNGMLGARQAEVAPAVLLSNSPQARNARMRARLQRKVEERKTKH